MRVPPQLWPVLTFHYGFGIPELRAMPYCVQEMYLEALPDLLREQQLRGIEVSSFPHTSDEGRDEILSRYAQEDSAEPEPEPLDYEQLEHALPGIGISVVREG